MGSSGRRGVMDEEERALVGWVVGCVYREMDAYARLVHGNCVCVHVCICAVGEVY